MFLGGFILLLIFHFAKNEKIPNDRLVGVDTKHDIVINKDTIISKNMIMQKKNREKKSRPNNHGTHEPDWSYSSFPERVKKDVEEFKRNMSECLKEVQMNDKRPLKSLSPIKESPVHGECLIACVLKRNGVIENGKIIKDNLLSLVRKFYEKDDKLMKKLEKNLDRCIQTSLKSKDDCEIASHLNNCTNGLMANNKHKISVNY
ncbi:uncharacterized protein LOC123662759 [Melitaea cinxia]|uniref:uncharacterized protein LOC123662759 n=1 Tax=Melitaea cinxia TaxID=113334 RepID=UPI001E272E2E|nr:uncharacterized protein LOC123662759 [Melitaea cinxia]